MENEIMQFGDYANSPIFSKLTDISDFRIIADIPHIRAFSDELFSRRVTDRIYEQIREVLRAAGFYYENSLEVVGGSDYVGVRYQDDQYDFRVQCSEGTITIQRDGSSLKNFHEWYTAFMPSAQGILTNVSSILEEALGRNMNTTRGVFMFKFLLYDLRSESTQSPVRNSEVMQKLLRDDYPKDQGVLEEGDDIEEIEETPGRVDVSIARWSGKAGRRRLARFSVEAPGNRAWSTLWFTLGYGAESYRSPDARTREQFDPDRFWSEYDRAYVTFLRDSAINGLIKWLMDGYSFKSTAGDIP